MLPLHKLTANVAIWEVNWQAFLVAGGMVATAKVVYKRIASLIADKHNKPYSKHELAQMQTQLLSPTLSCA